jgi:hypothetical protein
MDGSQGEKTPVVWWIRYRVLLYCLAGLIGLDLAVFCCRQVWRAYDPDDYRDRLENCRRHPADLVFVGGSPVRDGVDPAWFTGLRHKDEVLRTAYNLGLPGATTLEVWHAVKHGLAARPRLLVYGITATDLNDSRLEPHGPRTLMNAGDLLSLARRRPRAAAWCTRHYARDRLGRAWKLFYYRHALQLWFADCLETWSLPGSRGRGAGRPTLQRRHEAARWFFSSTGMPESKV